MKQYSSIFNDVLGPIMCGPSSSHTAASVRIGNLMRQMLPGTLTRFTADFDPSGALAACYHEQCSDAGLAGGLLNMKPDDERLLSSLEIAEQSGLKMEFRIVEYPNRHPNTYRMKVENDQGDRIHAVALSIGGGMIEFVEIENYPVLITGGFYETLIFIKDISHEAGEDLAETIKNTLSINSEVTVQFRENPKSENTAFAPASMDLQDAFFEIRTETPVPKNSLNDVLKDVIVERMIGTAPILPLASQLAPFVPFHDAAELLEQAKGENQPLWELAVRYESVRGNRSEAEVREKMRALVSVMKKSLNAGLAGTFYEKRILGCQSKYFEDAKKYSRLIPDDMVNEIIRCVSAFMEVKSSMGIFVAAPTAGSCGGLPGTVFAIARKLDLSDEQIVKAMFAAGIIGVFLSEKATFAAEVAGCQAECGSGSGMAAAALVQLMDGSAQECCTASSMALQNVFGLTCDPVAMAVEVPCLGKNIMSGMNALSSANMALAGFDAVIPLDETIAAFNEAGRLLPPELRCTGGAGLTKTLSSIKIEKTLFRT